MKDTVRSAIARNLGVSEHSIISWRIAVGAAERQRVEAELEVKIRADGFVSQRLRERYNSEKPNSLYLKPAQLSVALGEERVYLDIVLLYGKETQHIFKALHQLMMVRGPQKRKKIK
jgi:hypothetical protein